MSKHDKAVELIAAWLRTTSPVEVHTNPGRTKNHEVDGRWPDLVCIEKISGSVAYVGEVETEESLTAKEAEQWKAYSWKGYGFSVFVPAGCCREARKLASDADVHADINEYTLTDEGAQVLACV